MQGLHLARHGVYLCWVRVLYLTYDGLTDPLGRSQILPYIVGLRRRIGEVFAPDIVSFEKTERYAASGEKLREMLSTEGISWYSQKFHTKPPLLSKAYDDWRFFQVAWKLTRERSYDVYHARSYVAGWVAHRLSARTGRPWIFDMRGFWADERRDYGFWPQGHPLYNYLYHLWKKREQTMLKAATAIIVLTEAAKEVLLSWGIPSQKITVIPCVADYEFFHLAPAQRQQTRQSIRETLNIPADATLLLYSGSLASHYAPEDIVDIFEAAYRIDPKVFLLVLTPNETSSLERLIQQRGLPLSQYRAAFASRMEMPSYLSAADVGMATVLPTFAKVGSSFTKVAEYLAADLPVIATAIGDVKKLAGQLPGLFPYQSREEIPSVVERVFQFLRQERLTLPAPLSVLTRPILSLEVGLDRYQAVYEGLFQEEERRRVLTT
jgi:glycosyltransferase involved in cell wall biosynthesis